MIGVTQILLTYIMGIKLNMGVKGIWYSILFGNVITTFVFIFVFTRFNFEKGNVEAKEMMEKDQILINRKELIKLNHQ